MHVACNLVHSMARGSDFAAADRRAAGNFGRAAARAGVRRIIYLGGLTEDIGSPSAHLRSRAETGEVLRASGVPVIEVRASVVMGAGSLSVEMIQALVERLPAVVCPRWVATLTQPIATGDVLTYLAAALDLSEGSGGVFEIGGPEVVSYGDMMREYARLRGLHRVPVPVRTPHLSGLWLAPVTPAQARVGRGRHDSGACAVGDAIDGWTVEAYERDHRLRPSADLELPGRGWLEFEVTPLDGGRRSRIRQTATFDLRGVLGRLYWYAVQPIHRLMFRGMLDRITRRAHAA